MKYFYQMKIAFFSAKNYDRESFDRYNTRHEIIYYESPLNEQTINLAEGCSVVCVFVNDKLNARVLTALKKAGVQLIALRCAGFNNVDLIAAKENNITIVRVPSYSPHAVAEHAVALILTLNRKTHKAYNRVREGNFSLERLTGFDLYGKTVGVIGTGKIGQSFCTIMLGFGFVSQFRAGRPTTRNEPARTEMERRGAGIASGNSHYRKQSQRADTSSTGPV